MVEITLQFKNKKEKDIFMEQPRDGWKDEDCAIVCDDCHKMIGSGTAPV